MTLLLPSNWSILFATSSQTNTNHRKQGSHRNFSCCSTFAYTKSFQENKYKTVFLIPHLELFWKFWKTQIPNIFILQTLPWSIGLTKEHSTNLSATIEIFGQIRSWICFYFMWPDFWIVAFLVIANRLWMLRGGTCATRWVQTYFRANFCCIKGLPNRFVVYSAYYSDVSECFQNLSKIETVPRVELFWEYAVIFPV